MSRLVQMDALRVGRPDGKWSDLRIQRINASLAVADAAYASMASVAGGWRRWQLGQTRKSPGSFD